MKNYCVKLWDNSCVFTRSNAGFIDTYYLSAKSITAAIQAVLAYAKKSKFSSCRVVDACEIEEHVL